MLTWTAIRAAWAPTPPSACPLALRMSWDGLLEHGWRTWCARKTQEINSTVTLSWPTGRFVFEER